MQLSGALADLLALVHTHGTVHPDIASRVSVSPAASLPEFSRTWTFDVPPLEAPRQAAVLLLFGSLDDRPASFQRTIVPKELDLLLTQRSMVLRTHPGQVSFPGGGRDPEDADAVACAVRETLEETGVDPAGIIPLGELPEVPLSISNYAVTPVIGWWQHPHDMITTEEATRVFRVPVGDLVDPRHRVTAILRHGTAKQRFGGPAFTVAGTLVWGFTAIIIDRVLELLGWAEPWDRRYIVDITGWNATQAVPEIVFDPHYDPAVDAVT